MNVVPDASVVVKWFVPERHHEPARALRDDYLEGHHDLVVPALLPLEVTNALKYSQFHDEERLSVAAESLVEYGLELRPFGRSGAVAETAVELGITVYDASYLALAAALDCPAYTADERMLEAVSETDDAERVTHIADYR
ncbi:MAG: type II toxin-antitoxin system VapC family toxin [Halobacteriales archaeon]